MNISELKVGAIIEGPKWPDPVEIKKIEPVGDDVNIVGSRIPTGIHVDVILSKEELTHISLKTIDCDFSSEPWKLFLALETIRYRFASLYDPLLAMNTSKVDPLPHQIEAVYGHVLKLPRIRFLLAHDPGAGKTIMAGLIIKEMKLRHLVNRILIVVPGHLKDQWRRELKDKFEEAFVIADRGSTNALYGENVWSKENQIVTSIDFAKRDEILPSLQSSQFDLIIVDEAHKMAAYKYSDSISKTGRYKLGEILSTNSEHLLFLTATPHKGDTENFRLFLDLLEPGFFATPDMLEESIEKDENSLFLRRIKEDMKDFDGKPLFLPRHVFTPSYNLSGPERDLYRKITEYVRNQYNKALSSEKKRNIGFALIILQRRLASSSFALWKSLQRRRDRLQEILKDFEKSKKSTPKLFDFDDAEDLSEEERWQQEKLWETLSIAENRDELQKEINILGDLIDETKKVIDQEVEVKLQKLKETMKELEEKSINKKILIFTESKDTLEYLEKRIKTWGYTVSTIHGGMQLLERIEAEKIFKTQTQVMIATEAAGEGINLQFCHLMINYDIPWNPNRLEQRMGRVHRYGQKFEVFVYNLIAQDTIEGRIFKRLFEKLAEIKAKLGSDKVYDIIGEIYYGKDLSQLLTDAAMGARTEDEILQELEITVDEEYIKKIRDDLGDTLATKHIDFTQIRDLRERARENKLIPEYTADFFKKAFIKAEGKIRERPRSLYAIDSIPYWIRNIAKEDSFKKSFGPTLSSYPKITFDKEIGPKDQDAEFITFGHPLFEAVLEWISRSFSADLQKGAEFIDHSGHLNGTILFFEGAINDGTGRVAGKRLFSYYIDSKTNSIEYIQPTILWDLEESKTKSNVSINLEELKNKVLSEVITTLRNYQNELLEERTRQAEIKEKYGIESLQKLIFDHDSDLLKLRNRKEKGENVDLAIRNKEERQRQYMDNKKHLEDLIQREKSLTISTPIFLGIIQVSSPSILQDEMKENAESEQVAMEVVMKYETNQGRVPTDVSKIIGPGYDIKSIDKDGNTRYIEVKGRNGVGAVALSKNEWFKSKHLAEDYYLYVVWNTKDYPGTDIPPLIIQDPANNLDPKLDVHYLIDSSQIKEKSLL
ncbi:DNA repair protein RAD50 [Marine Group I thaumarchaeote SCGC AAA799-P11]|uniref:DNA repair protein RAD50 n=1 Tax=Marine Group I thaumarchaeote SCGC AAA799-P11 TaxID=1502295 RepID=A0A087S380_9ARCH|nr:DNA repair protein RAD50 [Marine Group I thaumarchaeote SCGC AAA799-P11]